MTVIPPHAVHPDMPEDLVPCIDYCAEVNARFAKWKSPHRVEVQWRQGKPVFTVVQYVPLYETTEDYINELLAKL